MTRRLSALELIATFGGPLAQPCGVIFECPYCTNEPCARLALSQCIASATLEQKGSVMVMPLLEVTMLLNCVHQHCAVD